MTLVELKQHIAKSDSLSGLYIFTGEETVILKIYIDNIIKKSNLPVFNYDSVKPVYNKLSSNSLIGNQTGVYIIKDDNSFFNSEKDWNVFNSSKIIKNNIIILVYTTIAKSSKFYKHFSDNITLFEQLNSDILTKYVLKELPSLNKQYAEEIVSICENSYSRILLETDKIKHLSESIGKNYNETYVKAMQDKFIYIPPEDAIFSFVDSCMARHVSNCYYYLEECKKINENELNVLSNLYTKFRVLLQVQSLGYNKDICNITGLQFYQIKQVEPYVNNYTLDELFRALRLIHYCELSIKQGTMETENVLDYMLVNLI
jgi:DNA polymerase III delta subunit